MSQERVFPVNAYAAEGEPTIRPTIQLLDHRGNPFPPRAVRVPMETIELDVIHCGCGCGQTGVLHWMNP